MDVLVTITGVVAVVLALIMAFFTKKKPAPPTPLASTVGLRCFDVYRARSSDEWARCPGYQPGWAAYTNPSYSAFNFDAFPSALTDGAYSIAVVLEAARAQDKAEGRDEGRLVEDFILHEVAGHKLLGVPATHESLNTLMNARNGPKTEADRQQLRDVLLAQLDCLAVHLGNPGA